MRVRAKVVAFCAAFALASGGAAQGAPDAFAGAAEAYLVLANGVPLWSARADEPRPPASLTKLMTALLVAEAVPDDAVVTVSERAAQARGARMGLVPGARLAAGDLLAGLLLQSGNDACIALAEHVAGREAAFVARMNERAQAWGLRETRFANACGFDAPGHQSSPRDLAALATRLMAEPRLARRVAAERMTVRDHAGRRYALTNTNVLLGLVPGLAGVKTGYTSRGGRCLVAYARRDGRDVMVVLLRGSDRWWDAVAMIEQAFEHAAAAPRR